MVYGVSMSFVISCGLTSCIGLEVALTDVCGFNSGKLSEAFRQQMEQMVTRDEMPFRGIDLATLIRKKYGVSYDVQFIKKVSELLPF